MPTEIVASQGLVGQVVQEKQKRAPEGTKAPMRLQGTGVGTGVPAATDVAKETGDARQGGYALISDWTDPGYIGHGVAHRDPATGKPVPADVHIPTDGELHPEVYRATNTGYVDPKEQDRKKREEFLEKYSVSKPNSARANYYGVVGRIQSRIGNKERGAEKIERAREEKAVYLIDHPVIPQFHD